MTAHVAERRGALSEVVAANVRAECARRGWHQGVVAERMGMARNAVSDRARGRTPWTLDEVAQLAVLFGVEVSELLAEDHEQRHARARELTVERFLTAPVFS